MGRKATVPVNRRRAALPWRIPEEDLGPSGIFVVMPKRIFNIVFIFILFYYLSFSLAFALPEGWSVESGNASFNSSDPSTLNITADDKAVINFNSFNILQNEAVNFIQPGSASSVLSRVTGADASKIYGSLSANGNLFLINPSGIYFAPSANVKANAIVASTLDINTNNFVQGNYVFERNAKFGFSQILNKGRITANNIALLGNSVNNSGILAARVGSVNLASGNKVTVSFDAKGLIQVAVNEKTSGQVTDINGKPVKEGIANSGEIEAGVVYVNTQTAKNIFKSAVNLSGVIKATGFQEVNGTIRAVSNENIEVSSKLNTTGDTTLAADNDIAVKADIVADSGNLNLLADNDLDGVGSFKQDAGTTISTINYGDITIQASGLDSTLGNISSAGSLILKQGGAPVVFTQWAGSRISTVNSLQINPGVILNAADTRYEIGRDWINLSNFNPGTSKVSLVSAQEARVLGNNIFYDFSATVPEKIIRFDTENPQAILGTLTLVGGYGKLLTLTSIDPVKQWTINPLGQTDIQYALISNSINIRGPPLAAIHSNSLGNLTNWDVLSSWTGQGSSNNWSNPDNWDTGTTPTEFDTVVLDGISGINPNKDSLIDLSFAGTIDNLIINGYSGTLTLARDLTLKGDFNHQTGAFLPLTYNISFIDASKPSNILGNNTFYNFSCSIPDKILQFEAGKTQTILGAFNIKGAYAHLVKLLSTEQAKQWLIDPKGIRDLNFVWVQDSNNIAPVEMYIDEGTNRGNCSNWDPVATWTGTTSGSWSVGTNWSSGVVPGPGDDLVFPIGASNPTNTNDIASGALFNSITISGSGYTLGGNEILLGAGIAGITDSNSSGGNTINFAITLNATRSIYVTNSGEILTINGCINGVGGITKEGVGKLVLTGVNTYAGVTTINVGVINIQNASALGSIAAGTTVVGGAALEIQGTINVGQEALALNGTGVSGGGALRNVLNNNSWAGQITVVVGNGPEIASDSGILTITGGVTTAANSPFIVDGAGNVTFSMAPIATGSGTLTKNGSGTLTLAFANTYTGLTTINAGKLLYGCNNAILSGGITVSGGTLDMATYSDIVGAVILNSGIITGTGILTGTSYTVNSGTISAILGGTAALTKNTIGTVTLTRDNIYTGATTVSAGILDIQSNFALGVIDGTTTVSSGATLQIDGNGLSIAEPLTISGVGVNNNGAIRNLANNNTLTGAITLGAASQINCDSDTLTISTGGVSGATLGLTIDGAGNVTFSTAPIATTSGTVTKNGSGTVTFSAPNTYTGATTVNAGTLVMSGAGSSVFSAFTVNSGATLTLDNGNTNGNRLGDGLALTMNGGNFNFIGNSISDCLGMSGTLTLSSGENIITVTPNTGGMTTLIFSSLSRSAGATVLFRGTNFGSTPGANVSTIMFGNAPALIGGAGAANSTTVSIIKGAFGDGSLVGNGTDMVTYNVGNTNGLRLLNGAGFSTEYAADFSVPNSNVKLTSNAAAVALSINSLILNGGDVTNASVTLTLGSASLSGNILAVTANNIAGANTTIAFGTVEGSIRATSNVTISAAITTSGGLTKSGNGILTVSSANSYTGLTSINAGTLLYGINNALPVVAVTVNDATLDLSTYNGTVGAVILQSGTITGTGTVTGILTGASYDLRSGTVSAILAGAVALNKTTTSTATTSTVILTRENTYTGLTTISGGVLKLGAAGNGTNSPLGTIAAGTTVSSGAMLDLNGYTLSTAEALTLNGTGIASQGALMNSSASAVNYSGLITLGAASSIEVNNGDINITNAGTITGATLGLTLGGTGNGTLASIIGTTSGTVTKTDTGTWTLSGVSTYTGATTISVGTLKIGAAGDGTNSPLGTVTGATTVTSGAVLDLNGWTLSTTEPLTLNGTGINNSGALMNSSASAVTFSGLITLASASSIEANYGDINLTNAGPITGSGLGLTLGGTGNGTLASIVGTVAGTISKIDSGTWTLSGASTYTGATLIYAGALKLGATGSGANTPLGTVGTGTTVYSGAVLDLNGYTLITAEGLTLNGKGINNGGALINNSGSATGYSGAITLGSDTRITNSGAGTLTLSGGSAAGAFNLTVGGAGNTTFSTVSFSVAGLTLTKEGSGTLLLSLANGFTGLTLVTAGTLKYGVANGLSSGPVTITGGAYDLASYSDTVGVVTLMGGSISDSVGAGILTATSYTVESGTISAIIAGAVTMTKNTTGTVTMTAAETYSGATTINAGTITLSGAGTAVSSAFTINLGGILTLDNNSGANNTNRLGDALAITMNGGYFNFIGSPSAIASETTGVLTLSSGYNTISITQGAGGSTTLTFASITRTAGATVLFRGNNLGANPGAGNTNIKFTTSTNLNLTGGAGAAGSTTIKIVPYAIGDTSVSGSGFGFVTYNIDTNGNTNGIRPLVLATEYDNTNTPATGATVNVRLTANYSPNAARAWNALLLGGSGTTYTIGTSGSTTLTITAGTICSSGSAANTIAGGANFTLVAAASPTNEFNIFTIKNLTISAVIANTNTPALSTGSIGTLTLSGANAYTGTTTINTGTLLYGASAVIVDTVTVTVNGGTYNLAGYSDIIGALNMTAGTITTGAGTLTLGGTVTTTASIFSSTISGNLGLGAARIFNIADGPMLNDMVISAVISGAFTLTKSTGTGILLLSGNNTYSGLTTISNGILKLGVDGDGTNTPLGTAAAGTSVGSGAALDLNGHTLSTAEALSLNGTGISSGGALMNSDGTAVSYSGLITLAGASSIIADNGAISITNGGTITGATLGLTLGGNGNGSLASIIGTTSGTLTKSGAGTWTVSGSSTYTGLTTISAGVLKLGATGDATNTPLGTTGAGTSITSGAVLDLNGFTLGTSEGLTLNGSGIATCGALMNSSASSVTYSGLLILGSASTIVANYGDININNAGTITGATFGLTLSGAGNGTLASIVGTTTGTITMNGIGTWTLSGSSTYTGATTINSGTLKLGATGDTTNTPLGTTGTGTTVIAGAVLDLNGNTLGTAEGLTLNGTGILNGGALINNSGSATVYKGAITINSFTRITNSGSGTLTLSGGSASGANPLFIGGAGNTTFSSVSFSIAGMTLTKDGSGTLQLNFANGFTGLTLINAGTLKYGVANALSSGNVTVAGGTFDIASYSDTVGAVRLMSGTITDSVGGGTLTGTSFVVENGTVSAILGGAVALTKNTGGTVTLTKANSYTGLTTVNAGTLALGIASAINSSSSVTVSGGILDISSYSDSVGTVTLTSGTITGTSGVLTSSANFALQSGLVSAILSGSGYGVTKTTAGTVTLTRANTFTGASSIAATSVLNIQDPGALGTGSVTITITSTGALQLQGGITVTNTKTLSLAGTGVATDGALRNISGTNEWQGTVTMTLASRINSDMGTLTVSGNIGGTYALTVGGGGNTTISGAIGTTTGTLTKDGAGTLLLSGNNSYTGATTISAGIVKLGIAGSSSNGPLGTTAAGTTVSAGASLDLNGITLTNSEGLTLNGTGVGNGGALMNSSASAATYSGLLILGSASSIEANSGDINITNVGTITGSGFGLTLGGSGNGSLASIIGTVAGTLTKIDSGTWTVSGNSTYTGLTTISAGILKLGAAGSGANTPLGTVGSGTVVSATNAALDLNGFTLATAEGLTLNGTGVSNGGALMNSSASTVSYSGLLILGSNTTIEANSGTINITNVGTITGATYCLTLGGTGAGSISSIIGTTTGTLTKIDSGMWTLSGVNTFTGGVTLNAGTLNINNSQALGTIAGTFTIAGGTIDNTTAGLITTLNYPMSWNADFAFTGTQNLNLGTGTVTMSASRQITVNNSNTLTVGGLISGPGFNLTKAGTGTLTLGGASTLPADLIVNAGTLSLAANVSITANLTVSGGIMNLSTFTANRATSGGTLTVSSGATLKLSGSSGGQTGSNFPTNYTTISLDPAGTVEYNSANTVNQTIYAAPTYGNLTLSNSTGSGTTTKTAGNALTVKGNLTIGTYTTFDTGNGLNYAVTVSGNWSNSGTFTPRNGIITFDSSSTRTLASGGSSFYALTHSGTGTLQLTTNSLTLTNNLINSAGTFDLNGQGLSVTGTVTNAGIVQLQGNEAVTLSSGNDISQGVWVYVGRNIAENLTIKDFSAGGADYYNITINDVHASKATFVLGAGLNVAGALTISSGTLSLSGNSLTVTGAFNNEDTIRLQGVAAETVTLSSGNDTASGTWEYAGRNVVESLTIKDFGGTDYYNLKINDTNTNKATFALGNTLNVAGTLIVASGTMSQGAYNITAAAYSQTGGTFTGGSVGMTVNGAATISGGTMLTPSGASLSVVSMAINSPGIVRLQTNGILILTGSGTQALPFSPLTGNGTLDLSTNTPNTVEYTGQGVTDIATAGPLSGYYDLLIVPAGLAQGGKLTLNSGGDSNLESAVIDTTGGYAYFGEDSTPGRIVKIRLSDMTSVGVLTLNQGEDSLFSAAIDTTHGFAYFGTYTSPGKVIKVQLSDFTRNAALTLNTGEDYLHSAAIDVSGGYVYFGNDTIIDGDITGGKVIKIRLSDFTRFFAQTLNPGENRFLSMAIDPGNHYLYAGTYTNTGKIIKMDISGTNLSHTASLDSGVAFLSSAVIDTAASYLYFGTDTSPGKVVRADLTNFIVGGLSTITLQSGEEYLYSALLDKANNYLYFGAYTSPGKIIRININGTFVRDNVLTLNTGQDLLAGAAVINTTSTPHYVYYGTVTSPGKVVRVDLSNFISGGITELNLLSSSDESGLSSAVLDNNGYAYFGTDTSPGYVVKVQLSSDSAPTRVGVLTLNTGDNYLKSAVIDTTTTPHYAYFGTDTFPGIVVRLDLSNFASGGITELTLNTGDNRLQSAVIDAANHYAYFGTSTMPGKVVRVNLSNFVIGAVSELTLNAGDNYLTSAVIDTTSTPHYAYFGTSTAPGKVVRIDLSNFLIGGVTERALNTGEDYLASAVIDTSAGYAYFGTYTSPGIVVKVKLSDFTRNAALSLNSGENGLTCAVIDTTKGYAFFGTSTARGNIVQVQLSDFTRGVGIAMLNPGEDFFSCAVIDTTNGAAYFGTYAVPGVIIKGYFSVPVFRLGSGTLTILRNLTIGNSASVNAAVYNPVINVSGNFLIQAGGFFTASGSAMLTVYGNWTNSGSFTHSSGSVTLAGTNQSISGSTTFYSLTKTVTSTDTLTFQAGSTQTFAGTLTLRGAVSNLLNLRSSSPGTQWKLSVLGSAVLDYLDVQDSYSLSGTLSATHSHDSTRNTSWNFP